MLRQTRRWVETLASLKRILDKLQCGVQNHRLAHKVLINSYSMSQTEYSNMAIFEKLTVKALSKKLVFFKSGSQHAHSKSTTQDLIIQTAELPVQFVKSSHICSASSGATTVSSVNALSHEISYVLKKHTQGLRNLDGRGKLPSWKKKVRQVCATAATALGTAHTLVWFRVSSRDPTDLVDSSKETLNYPYKGTT